jgi:5S rRNA maturation endonuclease (ribonuclease M5)
MIVVEGSRDVEALRLIGFKGRIDVCSRVNVSDFDLAESLKREASSVVLLTDFDEEGQKLNRHLTRLLEGRGVKVEVGHRRQFGRLMAALGVYVIEALDNAILK